MVSYYGADWRKRDCQSAPSATGLTVVTVVWNRPTSLVRNCVNVDRNHENQSTSVKGGGFFWACCFQICSSAGAKWRFSLSLVSVLVSVCNNHRYLFTRSRWENKGTKLQTGLRCVQESWVYTFFCKQEENTCSTGSCVQRTHLHITVII